MLCSFFVADQQAHCRYGYYDEEPLFATTKTKLRVIFNFNSYTLSWVMDHLSINSFLASGDFCLLVITFANTFYQDQGSR